MVEVLKLDNLEIGSTEVEALVSLLRRSQRLETLSLREHSLSEKDLQNVLKALGPSIKEILLNDPPY